MSLNSDSHDFVQEQIDILAQDPTLRRDLSDALILLDQETKDHVAGLLRLDNNRKSTIALEELLLETV